MADVDQIASDITRDCESGHRSYCEYLEWAGLGKISTWNDLKPHFPKKNYNILREMYKNVEDDGLMFGLLFEGPGEIQAGPTPIHFYVFNLLSNSEIDFTSWPTEVW